VWFYRLFERVIRHEEEKLYVRFQEEKIEERRQRVLFASDPYTKQVAFYRHDMRNQLQTIQALQELGKDQEALHYLDQLIEQGRAMEAKHES
jgi:sensor histidine kinase regulating citrate/malate metabolism